jgi:DNA-binding CsgD family transcriptional regulator
MHGTLALFSNRRFETGGFEPDVGASQPGIGVGDVALNIFDRLSVGIVVLDRSAEVVFANAAAKAMSDNGGSLRVNGGVKSRFPFHDRHLGELVRAVIGGASARAMSIPSSDSGGSVMVLAAPVPGAGKRQAVRDLRSAAAMLVICDPDRFAKVPAAWMMDAYGLTSREARVALTFVSSATIPDTARRLKITPNTVKTHLKRIYDKTGTKRQTELTRLIVTISLVFGNENELADR